MKDPLTRKIEDFIRRMFYMPGDEECCYYALRHLNVTNKAGEVERFPADAAKEAPEDLASMIVQKAIDDASGIGGLQRYHLVACTKVGKQIARVPFKIDGGEDEEGDGDGDEIASEPATKAGMLRQQMRHNEAILRTSTMAQHDIVRYYQRMVVSLQEENERLRTERREMWDHIEDISTMKEEREIARLRAQGDEKRKDDVWDKLNVLGPILVNKVTGIPLLPAKSTSQIELLRGVCETLTAQQIASLKDIFDDAQYLCLIEIYSMFQKQEEAKKAGGSAVLDGPRVASLFATIAQRINPTQITGLQQVLNSTQILGLMELYKGYQQAASNAGNGGAKVTQ